ncbi:Hypothetical predicted protein [Lecanosticta acicola]|uniref:Uncharacterized protein n=1 Tax=Lecanosticta acicola TaxID=111012 RepID=A0AAI8YSL8_9PEZI|nr:Hypothetical predicted protein [Lecanosticta acicola]
MPTSLSGSTRSQSAADRLSLDSQPAFREALEALNIDLASNGIPADHLQSHFLALPAELRTAIYTTALFDDCNDLNIIYTNRQAYMEASPILYQRPINFPSQTRLMAWITRSSQTDLNRVRTLTLRLTDVDFSPLFESSPTNRTTARPTAWNLYQQELETLDKALQSLPNLVHLAIIPPERNNSQLLRSMYFSFLGLIPERLPRLRRLTIHDEDSLQDKIPNLKKLPDVVFDQPKSASSSPSSSASREFRSFSDVMKQHAPSPTPPKKVKSEKEAGGMEGVWFG